MNKKIIDYEGFEAYAQGVREKYATKNNLPKRISDLTEDTTHKTVTDDEKKRWNDKVDKVSGKALSSNDYTSADKAKVDAIPPNPKYTDTIPDLTPYAKTENIPTKVSQLNNDKKYMSLLDNPFFTMKNIQYQIKDDWNTQPFYQGWQWIFSHKKPNSPSNGNKYLVYTSFDSTTKPNENTPHVKSSIRQLALDINTGKWFLREGRLDPNKNKALSLSPNEQGELTELPYTINPVWYEWKEISSDYVTKEDVKKLINDIPTLKKEVVTSLPQTGKDDVIYLVKDDKGQENNNYLEYLWLNGKYELIGSTQVDLKNYARKIEIKTQLSEMTEDTTHRTVTDTEKNKWNNKVDKVDGKGLSTNDYTDEDKGKINAIPPNPKYTDTIPDLTPYAKKENIPTKVSQLENDNNYITGRETLFLNTFNGVYKILDGWNNFYFNQGWQLCESDDQPDSPCDNKQRTKYLVYTAFNAKVDDNGRNPILSEEVWQFAWHNLSGTWFCRRGTPRNDEKPTFHGQIQDDDNSFHYCYTISPKWSKWVVNKSNIDIQEFTQQELEEAFK